MINPQENCNVLPYIKEFIAFDNNLKVTSSIEIPINIEKIYSAFPCPKLWSSSCGTLEILFPIKVISDAKISPPLLKASAIIA